METKKLTKKQMTAAVKQAKTVEKTLEAFRVPDVVSFSDVNGNPYEGDARVSVMASLELSLMVEFLFQSDEGEAFRRRVIEAARGSMDQGVLGIAAIAVVSEDEDLNQRLDQLFDALHPGIREQAAAAVPDVPPHASTLFGAELKAALFPFLVVSYREKIKDQMNMAQIAGLV